MGQERTLSLVIPAKDEEANIATLLTEAYGVMRDYHGFEVVLVDDGSTDSTLDTAVRTARALGGRLLTIRHERSIGQSGALASGIRQARSRLIVTMDGDGQNDPADIPAMLQKSQHPAQPGFLYCRLSQESQGHRLETLPVPPCEPSAGCAAS